MQAENKMITEDPFKHQLQLTKWDWLRTYILAVLLVPIRVLLFFIIILLIYLFACIALSLNKKNLVERPYSSNWIKLIHFLFKIGWKICGFKVRVKGNIAPVNEAPIIIGAPHSTFFDGNVCQVGMEPASTVMGGADKMPILGKILQLYQCIFVNRSDPQSRETTKREIVRRTDSNNHTDINERWRHLIIFPEGICSNRKALLPFKPGAFIPGKPVQPAIFRWPNRIDTVTWTWDQPHGFMSVLWLTLGQPFTRHEVEFLPVYYPSTQEKNDPALYASNVRKFMATYNNMDTCDMTIEEVKKRYGKKSAKNDVNRKVD